MRLDKFLKVSRIIKRRTVANDACTAGRVTLNGKVAKPSAEVSVGDVLELRIGQNILRAQVETLSEHVSKQDAGGMYKILT